MSQLTDQQRKLLIEHAVMLRQRASYARGMVSNRTAHEPLEDDLLAAAIETALLERQASTVPSFDQAWAIMGIAGYRYGEDAIEQVKLGWHMRDVVGRGRS